MSRRVSWIALIIAVTLLTACRSDDAAPEAAESQDAGENQTEMEAPVEQDPESIPGPVLCQQPAPIEVGLSEPVDGVIEDPVWTKCFWVTAPENLASLTFELSGLTADLNMAVGYGFPVTMQYHIGEFWRVAEEGLSSETLTIENPSHGPYFITVGIAGQKDPSPFSLTVSTDPPIESPPSGAALPAPGSCASPAEELQLGSAVDSEIVGKDHDPLPHRYYCVEVPSGINQLVIGLSRLEGNLDLFVRHTRPAEWTDRSRGGSERVVVIDNPQSGAYFIDVVGALTRAGSPFTLSVNSE